jgi:hypothetical protein
MTCSHCISSSEPDVLSKLHIMQRKLLAPDGTQIYLAQLRQAMSATAAHLDKFVDMARAQPPEIDAVSWSLKVNLHKRAEKVLMDYEVDQGLRQLPSEQQEHQQEQEQQEQGQQHRSFHTYHEGLSWFKVNH